MTFGLVDEASKLKLEHGLPGHPVIASNQIICCRA